MALNREDASKVGYKAKIEWYKERAFDISDGKITLEDYLAEKSTDFEAQQHTPDELIDVLNDLSKKATKLEDKIAFLSVGLAIPINKDSMQDISNMIANLDSSSKGEYISYSFYDKLLREQEFVNSQISLDYMVNNATGDVHSDSVIIQDKIYQSYADYNQPSTAKNNEGERYTNRWLNNIVSWNEHDYQVRQIINFADNYLDINPDPSYIPWNLRRDVGESRVDVSSLSDVWKHFSSNYKDKVNDFVTGIQSLSSLKPDNTMVDLTTRYIVYTNNFLNRCNDVFDIDWAVDLVCCFMQWGIRLDLKTLKGLRAILQLLQTGLSFDFIDVLNGIKDIINNIFRGLLCNQLVGLIKQILQKLVDPIKKWITDPQDETWRKVFACTPIDELINKYIIQAIDYLESLLYSLIQSWYKKIELQNIKNSLKLDIKTNQKWMGELSRLLDTIIAVAEKAAQCGIAGSPNEEAVQQITKNYNIDNPTKYKFPEESSPNIYNSFIPLNPDPVPADSADTPKTINFDEGAIGSKISVNLPRTLSDCLKKIPVDQISGVKEWIDVLNSKSQERA